MPNTKSPSALVVLNSNVMSSSERLIMLFWLIVRLINEFPFGQLHAVNEKIACSYMGKVILLREGSFFE